MKTDSVLLYFESLIVDAEFIGFCCVFYLMERLVTET